jgi:hypothetical protein
MFDQYDQDQTVGITNSQTNAERSAGLRVWERPLTPLAGFARRLNEIELMKEGPERTEALKKLREAAAAQGLGGAQRVFVGRTVKDEAVVSLADAKGRPRIVMSVDAADAATLKFLDEDGKVIFCLPDDSAGRPNPILLYCRRVLLHYAEGIALGIFADGIVANAGDGNLRLNDLSGGRLNFGRVLVNRLHRNRVYGRLRVGPSRRKGAVDAWLRGLAGRDQPVVHRARPLLDLPAEDFRIELSRSSRIIDCDFKMDDSGHFSLLSQDIIILSPRDFLQLCS